jgi:hypothetical protein
MCLHYAQRARDLQTNLPRNPIGLQVNRESRQVTLECYLAVPLWFSGITRYSLQSRPFYLNPSRDTVRVELRPLFCGIPFETWLRDLPESGHNMLGRVSHLEIQNAYTHLPPQELVESMVSLPVRGDFTKNGRGALKYFTCLKRLTICPRPREYP